MSLLNKTKGNTLYFKKKKIMYRWTLHSSKKKNQHINRERKNQRKKKKANMLEVKSNVRGIFYELPSFSFLPILGRKLFGGLREKILGSHNLFFFLPIQPNTLQKSFLSYFLSKVFHPSYFISK